MTNTPSSEQSSPMWEASVPEGHRKIVESGAFDTLPTKDLYKKDEIIIYRLDGVGYYIDDDGDTTVVIWYGLEGKDVIKRVPRGDVRSVADYGKKAYELLEPETEVLEVSENGHVVVSRQQSPPPFPDFD